MESSLYTEKYFHKIHTISFVLQNLFHIIPISKFIFFTYFILQNYFNIVCTSKFTSLN